MKKLFNRLAKCEHCQGWIDLSVQEFAWEQDSFYHTYCWFEIYRKEAEGVNRPDSSYDTPN